MDVVETVLTKLGRPTDTATMESLLRRWTLKCWQFETLFIFSVRFDKNGSGKIAWENGKEELVSEWEKSTFLFADEFLLVVALMDVTDMASIEDSAFSTGFLVFDQVLEVII